LSRTFLDVGVSSEVGLSRERGGQLWGIWVKFGQFCEAEVRQVSFQAQGSHHLPALHIYTLPQRLDLIWDGEMFSRPRSSQLPEAVFEVRCHPLYTLPFSRVKLSLTVYAGRQTQKKLGMLPVTCTALGRQLVWRAGQQISTKTCTSMHGQGQSPNRVSLQHNL
jgi:hypothetical protein